MLIKRILFWIVFIVLTFLAIIGTFVLIGIAQERLLLPQDYIIWIFKYPVSRLTLFYVIEFAFLFYIFIFRELGDFVKRHRKWLYPTLAVTNLASTANFELLAKNLDKIYSDRIKSVLNNVK